MIDSRVPSGYTLVNRLGEGGTAEVFRARSEKTGREVALKIPYAHSDESEIPFAKLVLREQHLIGGLRFPGLVRILDFSGNKQPYLALELCSGTALDEVGRIDDLLTALNILSAIAIDLEYLNLMDIFHGDLKPQNIFLPPDWQQSCTRGISFVKLSDFSLGKLAGEPDDSRAGLGTVGFMAPETIADGHLSHQSDLFALGIIAYQIMTGKHPFMEDDSDPVRINARCTEYEPPPIKELRPEIPNMVNDLIARLLAKQASERPLSAWDVCLTLRDAGATYPFEKVFSPVYGIRRQMTYDDNVDSLLPLDEKERKRLDIITNKNIVQLHHVLAINHRRQNTHYENKQFVFRTRFYWPNRMRKQVLQTFFNKPLTTKKQLLKHAITGDPIYDSQSGFNSTNNPAPLLTPTLSLLRHLLRPVTIRRLSTSLAKQAKQKNNNEQAARLYVQAGDLHSAEQCAYEAAAELQKEHKTEQAIRILDHVIEFSSLQQKEYETRHLLMLKGDILKDTGEVEQALSVYNEIIALYNGRETDKLLAETYKDIGDLHRMRQRFKEGLSALNKALSIYKEHNDKLEISHTLNNIGNIYWISNNLETAIKYYRQALHLQRRLDAKADIASTLSNIGTVYVLLGKFTRSIQIMKLSLNLKKELGTAGDIARTLNNLGYVYYLSGKPNKAVLCLQESLEINQRLGSKKEILFNLENLSALMISAGQLQESLQTIQQGIELAEQVGDKPHFGIFHLFKATVLRRMGRYVEAETNLAVVDTIIAEIDDKILQVQTTTNRAAIRFALGDREQALPLIQQVVQTAAKLNAKSEQLNALLLLTRIHNSPEYEQTTLQLIDELNLTREKILIVCNKLELLLHSEKYQEAGKLVDGIISKIDTMSEDIELAWIGNLLADYYLATDHHEKAEHYLKQSLQSSESSSLIPEKINTLIMMGKINSQQGNFEQAFSYYKEALQLAKQIAAALVNPDDRKLYQSQRFVGFLVSEIKSLQGKIGKKKSQQTTPALT